MAAHIALDPQWDQIADRLSAPQAQTDGGGGNIERCHSQESNLVPRSMPQCLMVLTVAKVSPSGNREERARRAYGVRWSRPHRHASELEQRSVLLPCTDFKERVPADQQCECGVGGQGFARRAQRVARVRAAAAVDFERRDTESRMPGDGETH